MVKQQKDAAPEYSINSLLVGLVQPPFRIGNAYDALYGVCPGIFFIWQHFHAYVASRALSSLGVLYKKQSTRPIQTGFR